MKCMVIDGNSIINRAFYGIRPLTNWEGLYTHAVFGFLTTLLRLKEEEQPEALCVTFDLHDFGIACFEARFNKDNHLINYF